MIISYFLPIGSIHILLTCFGQCCACNLLYAILLPCTCRIHLFHTLLENTLSLSHVRPGILYVFYDCNHAPHIKPMALHATIFLWRSRRSLRLSMRKKNAKRIGVLPMTRSTPTQRKIDPYQCTTDTTCRQIQRAHTTLSDEIDKMFEQELDEGHLIFQTVQSTGRPKVI